MWKFLKSFIGFLFLFLQELHKSFLSFMIVKNSSKIILKHFYMIFEDQKKKNIMVIIVLIMPPRGHLKNAWFFVLWNSWGHFVTCSLTCFLVNSSLKLVIGTEHTLKKKKMKWIEFFTASFKKEGMLILYWKSYPTVSYNLTSRCERFAIEPEDKNFFVGKICCSLRSYPHENKKYKNF